MARRTVTLEELASHMLREVSSAHATFEAEQYYTWVDIIETRRKHNDIAAMGAYQYLGAESFDLEMDLEPIRFSILKRFGWWLGIGKRPDSSRLFFKLAKDKSKRKIRYSMKVIREDHKGYKTEHKLDNHIVEEPNRNYVTGAIA